MTDARTVWDVSMPLGPDTEPWPGDTAVSLRREARLADGDTVNLGTLVSSLHNGTHADAPLHVLEDGAPADRLPLEAFMGPAVVLDAPGAFRLTGEALAGAVPRSARVLLRAGRPDPRRFPERVTPVPPEWIAALAELDVPLLGTDQPSVDPVDSTDLAAHRACFEHGIQVVENLMLEDVPSGILELVALPLKVEGADAAPLRAVLRRRD